MSDRIFGSVVIALSLSILWASSLIEESFIQDPLGPKAFPNLIAVIMGLCGAAMIFKPDAEPHWPRLMKLAELVATLGVMVAYAQLLPIAGFVVSTIGATAFLSWRLGATARQAGVGAVLIALGIYVVFQHVLGLNLAKGPWGF